MGATMSEQDIQNPSVLIRRLECELRASDLRTELWLAEDIDGNVDLQRSFGVRVTHIPTGVSAESLALPSQTLNKLEALRQLRSLLERNREG